MADLLAVAADLPERELAAGEALLTAGDPSGSLFVLLSGALVVRREDADIAVIDHPGSVVGEVALLLEREHRSTVLAVEATRVKVAEDGAAFMAAHPEVLRAVAESLAHRVDVVSGYLADIRSQYADVPGMHLVSTVLGRLSENHGPHPEPGSEREPDPEY